MPQQASNPRYKPPSKRSHDSDHPSVLGGLRDEGGFRIKRQTMQARTTAPNSILVDPSTNPSSSSSSIEDETAHGAQYLLDGPLRRVPPYFFTYLTFCKLRWRDRNLLEMFATEFRDKSREYYQSAIAAGQVTINGKVASTDTIIRNGDQISHRTHKHEPPVTSRPIRIVYEDNDLVVIDKPSGIPVHPTGRYRFNTVVMVLKHEMGKTVHPCNRLDRLTSGLMFLAKSGKAADKMGAQLRDRQVQKEYIARVKGEFPVNLITVDQPLKTVAPKVALNRVKPDGKPAITTFKRLSYDGHTSVVKCRPLTGRTHQIRVHLQYLGHPIANDPIYANEWVWGPGLGAAEADDVDDDEIAKRLHEVGHSVPASTFMNPFPIDREAPLADTLPETSPGTSPGTSPKTSPGEMLTGTACPVCDTPLYSDPGPNDLDLWLHALTYSSKDKSSWSYATEYPLWASAPLLPLFRAIPANDSIAIVSATTLVATGRAAHQRLANNQLPHGASVLFTGPVAQKEAEMVVAAGLAVVFVKNGGKPLKVWEEAGVEYVNVPDSVFGEDAPEGVSGVSESVPEGVSGVPQNEPANKPPTQP